MKPLDAAYHVVHDYEPDGATSLAPRMGKSPTTLSHEVKPPPGSMAKFGLVDAVKVTDLTGDPRILHAFAEAVGYRCLKVEIPEIDTHGDLLQATAKFTKEVGESLATMAAAIADGRICEREIHEFEREVADIAVAAATVAARMRALAATKSKLRALAVA